jgi:hypothetical protein
MIEYIYIKSIFTAALLILKIYKIGMAHIFKMETEVNTPDAEKQIDPT